MMLPNTIDHYPRGQWMVWIGQPFRQRQAPSGFFRARPGRLGREWFVASSEYRNYTGPDQTSRSQVISACQNVCWRGLSSVPKCADGWFRPALFCERLNLLVNLFSHLLEVLIDLSQLGLVDLQGFLKFFGEVLLNFVALVRGDFQRRANVVTQN